MDYSDFGQLGSFIFVVVVFLGAMKWLVTQFREVLTDMRTDQVQRENKYAMHYDRVTLALDENTKVIAESNLIHVQSREALQDVAEILKAHDSAIFKDKQRQK